MEMEKPEAMEPSAEQPESNARFGHFPQLPPDIRQKIWSVASSSPTSTPGVCIFSETYEPRQNPRLIVHEPCNRALLQTNTEAHDMALMSTKPTRDYNPQTDILYVACKGFYRFMDSECGIKGPDWVSEIRHLAISFSQTDRGLSLPYALLRLASLETLSIVYPGPSGTFVYGAAIEPPEEGAELRCFTEEELARISVTADSGYDTWAGAFPARWAANGVDHLKAVSKQLDRECRPRGLGDASPLWNDELQRLGIRFEARCFAPLTTREQFHLVA